MRLLPSHKRLLLLVMLLALVVGVASSRTRAEAPVSAPAVTVSAQAQNIGYDATTAVQFVLKQYGYTIAVDGVYGPQTTKVVMKWQKSNGLTVDGVAGPITQASLGLSTAVRVGNQQQVTPQVPAPTRSVEQLIRDIWPDDQEEKALRIAWRESGYQPGVTSPTGCCHGIFQIHEIHFSWMRNFGVTTVDQLFDAETNIRMAYELYKRAGGWGPWRLTA